MGGKASKRLSLESQMDEEIQWFTSAKDAILNPKTFSGIPSSFFREKDVHLTSAEQLIASADNFLKERQTNKQEHKKCIKLVQNLKRLFVLYLTFRMAFKLKWFEEAEGQLRQSEGTLSNFTSFDQLDIWMQVEKQTEESEQIIHEVERYLKENEGDPDLISKVEELRRKLRLLEEWLQSTMKKPQEQRAPQGNGNQQQFWSSFIDINQKW